MQQLQIYLAAVYTNKYMPGGDRYLELNEAEKKAVQRAKNHNILESYHYVHKQSFVDYMRQNDAKVFLDSGAFSAHTLGVKIDIAEYCNYIRKNEDIIKRDSSGALLASVLDGIGSDEKTYENQCTMEKLGVRPLPCFHFGENPKYLQYYIKNYEYITIGGLVPVSVKQAQMWLDNIWNKYLIDGSGTPKLKVHGFGITSRNLIERYPWYSCDSSSWIQAASFGNVFTVNHNIMSVSNESSNKHTYGQHFQSLSPMEKYKMDCYFYEDGFSGERLGKSYQSRAAYNLNSYIRLNEEINTNKKSRINDIGELF